MMTLLFETHIPQVCLYKQNQEDISHPLIKKYMSRHH